MYLIRTTAVGKQPRLCKVRSLRITADQVAGVRGAPDDPGQATPEQLARSFKRGRATRVLPLLESMTALGLAAQSGDGVYRPTQ